MSARIAVVLPVYRARFLGEALWSVFRQTHVPDEVIVVDDGSPDRDEIQSAIAPWRERLRLISQPNAGAGAARNNGVRASTADLIAFLDADDIWLPHYLEQQLEQWQTHDCADVVYADALYVGTTPLAGRRFDDLCPSRGEVTLEALLDFRCNIPMSAAMVRRSVLLAVDGFDEGLRRGQDFDLWLRLALHDARFHHHRALLTRYRVHDDNLSGTRIVQLQRPIGVLNKAIDHLPLTDAQREIALRQVARLEHELAIEQGKASILKGDYSAARGTLREAYRTQRQWKVGAALIGLHVLPQLVRRLQLAREAHA